MYKYIAHNNNNNNKTGYLNEYQTECNVKYFYFPHSAPADEISVKRCRQIDSG